MTRHPAKGTAGKKDGGQEAEWGKDERGKEIRLPATLTAGKKTEGKEHRAEGTYGIRKGEGGGRMPDGKEGRSPTTKRVTL